MRTHASNATLEITDIVAGEGSAAARLRWAPAPQVCVGRCAGRCIDLREDLCVDMCVDMCVCVYLYVCGHVCVCLFVGMCGGVSVGMYDRHVCLACPLDICEDMFVSNTYGWT